MRLSFVKIVSLIVGYYLLLWGIGLVTEIPNSENLIQWDAYWYKSIIDGGYFFLEDLQSNSGFFPGFPYLWKVLNFDAIGISLLNLLFFLSGAFLLVKMFGYEGPKIWYLLTLPSLFFMYVPYTESLFFLLCIALIYFWKREQLMWVFLFALLASLVRPMFFFMLPAVVVSGILSVRHPRSIQFLKRAHLIVALGIVLGALVGFTIIGIQVGDFFAYSKSQVNNWNHGFQIPSFPLTTWRGARILWLDFFALVVAVLALILTCSVLYMSLFNSKGKVIHTDSLSIISLVYLAMTLVYVLFFHPKEDGQTSILSFNRYVLCSPFFLYLVVKNFSKFKLNGKVFSFFGIAVVFALLMIGFPFSQVIEWNHSPIIFYAMVTGYISIQILPFLEVKHNGYLTFMVGLVNLTTQFYLFNSFLKGNWIG